MEMLEWRGYPKVKTFLKICLLVLTEYTYVTDGQILHDGIGRAYTQHRAAKTVYMFCSHSYVIVFIYNIYNIVKV